MNDLSLNKRKSIADQIDKLGRIEDTHSEGVAALDMLVDALRDEHWDPAVRTHEAESIKRHVELYCFVPGMPAAGVVSIRQGIEWISGKVAQPATAPGEPENPPKEVGAVDEAMPTPDTVPAGTVEDPPAQPGLGVDPNTTTPK